MGNFGDKIKYLHYDQPQYNVVLHKPSNHPLLLLLNINKRTLIND